MTTQLSPGIAIKEIDLTGSTAAIPTNTGGMVGDFQWGPVEDIIFIDNQETLKKVFGTPNDSNFSSWFTASNFLDYSGSLLAVRTVGAGALNATSGGILQNPDDVAQGADPIYQYGFLVKNEEKFEFTKTQAEPYGPWIARYAGELGNSIKVSFCPADSDAFYAWEYEGLFDSAPGTSDSVANKGGSNDELHIVVIDELGTLSGSPGTILEKYGYLSAASDAKTENGANNYYEDVLEKSSNYIYASGNPVSGTIYENWGMAAQGTNFLTPTDGQDVLSAMSYMMQGGAVGDKSTDGDLQLGWDLYKSKDNVEVAFFITGAASTTLGNYVASLAEQRIDCVAFLSPQYSDVVNNSGNEATDVVDTRNALNINSSYAIMDSGWKYQYDKFADKYRWVPLNADIAGLCARTDNTRAPWFSPAGESRGRIQNVVKLAYNPEKADRDKLYKNGVNPVINRPGVGPILFGDKTMLSKPSAFDRINVRRLFIVVEKTIESAARNALFEFNDAFTRGQFLALVEPYLARVQAQRGITDFKVVCDESNNPPSIVDNNQFIGDIYIKPARSINFINLNFVAVRSGVEFSEVVGTV